MNIILNVNVLSSYAGFIDNYLNRFSEEKTVKFVYEIDKKKYKLIVISTYFR